MEKKLRIAIKSIEVVRKLINLVKDINQTVKTAIVYDGYENGSIVEEISNKDLNLQFFYVCLIVA